MRFCVGGLDLPGKRKRYTSRREEGGVGAQVCPRGKAVVSSTYIGECEIHKEKLVRKVDEFGSEMFDTLLRGTIVNRTYGTHKNLYI